MRTPTTTTTSPWGNPEIDNGWHDLVVSSAPPPPPREALEPVAKNRPVPNDFRISQEHGSRAASVERPVDEPSFSAGDRRLWVVAGSLMAMATLVLGLLGFLTFGGSAAAPVVAAVRPVVVEPAAPAAPAHAVEPARSGAIAAPAKVTNPRHLTAKATKHGRHKKRALSAQR